MLSQLANSAMLRSARCTRCNQVSAAYTRINFCCHQEHSCRGARLVRNADADEVCNTCGLVFGRTMDDREKRMFEDSTGPNMYVRIRVHTNSCGPWPWPWAVGDVT